MSFLKKIEWEVVENRRLDSDGNFKNLRLSVSKKGNHLGDLKINKSSVTWRKDGNTLKDGDSFEEKPYSWNNFINLMEKSVKKIEGSIFDVVEDRTSDSDGNFESLTLSISDETGNHLGNLEFKKFSVVWYKKIGDTLKKKKRFMWNTFIRWMEGHRIAE